MRDEVCRYCGEPVAEDEVYDTLAGPVCPTCVDDVMHDREAYWADAYPALEDTPVYAGAWSDDEPPF